MYSDNPRPITSFLSSKQKMFGSATGKLPIVFEVEIAKLRPNPFQPRQEFSEEDLRELADSIAEHGLQDPIKVARDPENADGYVIVFGERRTRAHQLLSRERIQATLFEGDLKDIALIGLIENIQRKDLTPLEEAQAYQRLIDEFKLTHEEVAQQVGKSRVAVTKALKLNTLPAEIRQEGSRANISKEILFELASIEDEGQRQAAWEAVRRGEANRQTLRELRESPAKGPKAKPPQVERMLAHVRKFRKQLERYAADDVVISMERLVELEDEYRKLSELLNLLHRKQLQGGEPGEAR
jgi:ParB family transcriptional regulator, chromosome partitioning protein